MASRPAPNISPGMTFVYVSGQGTDSTGKGRFMWARVKGETEKALLALPFKAVMFRPGFIQPLHGITSRTGLYRALDEGKNADYLEGAWRARLHRVPRGGPPGPLRPGLPAPRQAQVERADALRPEALRDGRVRGAGGLVSRRSHFTNPRLQLTAQTGWSAITGYNLVSRFVVAAGVESRVASCALQRAR